MQTLKKPKVKLIKLFPALVITITFAFLYFDHLANMTPNPAESRNPGTIEFEPPLACVRRILKNTLPSSTNVGKDASAAYARAAGIFVIYITACANDFARENRRQTITANDVLAAIKVSQARQKFS
jgi:histone H3/H4